MDRTIATPEFCLEHDAFGRLVLVLPEGTRHVGVQPVRAFPITDPQHGLSLCDDEGRELAWIESLNQLPAGVRTVLETELASREFVPQIRRIISASMETNPCEWAVETDRGPTSFLLKNQDDVRRLGPHRALVIDAHGTRYFISDVRTLDRNSRRILERYL